MPIEHFVCTLNKHPVTNVQHIQLKEIWFCLIFFAIFHDFDQRLSNISMVISSETRRTFPYVYLFCELERQTIRTPVRDDQIDGIADELFILMKKKNRYEQNSNLFRIEIGKFCSNFDDFFCVIIWNSVDFYDKFVELYKNKCKVWSVQKNNKLNHHDQNAYNVQSDWTKCHLS